MDGIARLREVVARYNAHPKCDQRDIAEIADNTLGVGDMTIGDLRAALSILEGPAGAATASPEHDSPLLAFVRQSNAIEGIVRAPTKAEVEAHRKLLSLGVVEVADLEEFVRVCADARLRRGPGMDVRVGPHLPPRGGPQIEISLRELLADIQEGALSPWKAHVRYETLHPFMDGNGRSGRALWLWQMRGIQNVRQPLGFLHAFYYQTLQGSRS